MTVSLKKPDAIFFDWDGTLIDSLPALMSYYNHVLRHFSMPEMNEAEAKQQIRRSAREVFPERFGDKSDEAFTVYFDYVGEHHISHLKTWDGADNFIRFLVSKNIPIGVVSNKRHSFLLKEIGHLGWDKYLQTNIGAGEAGKDKPAPDLLLVAADKMGVHPQDQEIWYVGDTETDMMAAQAAGFQPIFIEHGWGTREDCQKHGLTPYFVRNFDEFIALVEKFA